MANMQFEGEETFAAPRERVYALLVDLDALPRHPGRTGRKLTPGTRRRQVQLHRELRGSVLGELGRVDEAVALNEDTLDGMRRLRGNVARGGLPRRRRSRSSASARLARRSQSSANRRARAAR